MKRPILSLFSVFFWFACSGAEPGPGAEEDTLRTESQFCSEWAKRACNESVVSACNAVNRDACTTTQKSACQVLVPSGYKSENAEDCLSAVEDAYEDAELTAEELEVVARLGGACSTLVDGRVDRGGSCASTFDCAAVDGFECVIKPGDTEGTCQVPVEVGGGDSCLDLESVCAADFFCDGTDCLRRRVADAVCTNDEMCAADLRCEIAAGAMEGTCVPRLANREYCLADAECQSGICLGSTDVDKICAASVILTLREPLCRELS